MKDIEQIIYELIGGAVSPEKLKHLNFKIEHPVDLNFGDYSTNVALLLAKNISDETGKSVQPKQVAEIIVEKLRNNLPSDIQSVEIAGPGFINFYLTPEFFRNSLNKIIEEEQEFGKNSSLKNQKVLIEYTDPNPLKQFHIGHLMSNAIGESLARIYKWNGARVIRMCYQGDVGMHVAKTLYGMQEHISNLPDIDDSLDVKMKFLAESYVYGAKKFEGDESDEEAQKAIKVINKKVYEFYDEAIADDLGLKNIYELGKKWSLKHFDEIYEKLGTNFDHFVMESTTFQIGEKIVHENTGNVFEKSEGAIIYKGEQDGLHTRVFINSSNLPLYESKDLGLAVYKDRVFENDQSIVITADEQKEYFKVVLAALKKIKPKIAEKTFHITHGMMQFTDGKMSSRKGNVITGESLISDVEKIVEEKIRDRNFTEEEKKEVKTVIAVGALKYSILKQAPGRNVVFVPDQATSFEGDSGPYVQYTYTRAKSILEKAANENKISNPRKIPNGWKTTKIEKLLYRFPELIKEALEYKTPHHIVTFMTLVASEFNTYYGSTQVLDGTEAEGYKLAITRACASVLKNCLTVVGIKAPEKM